MAPIEQSSDSSVPSIGMGGSLHDPQHRSVEWYTPAHIFEALGLCFDLDPAAPVGGVPWIPATRHYSIEDDGLTRPWHGRVWLNPPYGREAATWVDRLVQHGDGVALVFARVDSAWAQAAIRAADTVCLIAGRLSFIDGRGGERKGHNAAAASMLLGYGRICGAAVAASGLGIVFRPDEDEEAA